DYYCQSSDSSLFTLF
nr:immunoglobulin light chain junction region [Macaca mulatta]